MCHTSYWRIGVQQGMMAMEMRGRKYMLYRNNGPGAVRVLSAGKTAASKHLFDCFLTVAGSVSCYLPQTDLLHSFRLLCSIGYPFSFFSSFLSCGCIRVRFLRVNFLTVQKTSNQLLTTHFLTSGPLLYRCRRFCSQNNTLVYIIWTIEQERPQNVSDVQLAKLSFNHSNCRTHS